MKTVEAIISLMVLLSFTSFSLIHVPEHHPGLNKYQLAEDIWRIAYLKGCFNQSLDSEQVSLDTDSISILTEGEKELSGELVSQLNTVLFIKNLIDPTNEMEECLNPVFEEISDKTSLEIEFRTVFEAGGGPGVPETDVIVLHKVVVLDGMPQSVYLRVGNLNPNFILQFPAT